MRLGVSGLDSVELRLWFTETLRRPRQRTVYRRSLDTGDHSPTEFPLLRSLLVLRDLLFALDPMVSLIADLLCFVDLDVLVLSLSSPD